MNNMLKLKNSFLNGLGINKDINIHELKYRSIKQWDSVGHMQLISQIEIDFDIMIDTQDVIDMSSFDKAIEIIKKYGVNFEL